jgi:Family of unknown function (DUF5336)
MTYPPGGPGYPSRPPQAQYSAPTQQFDRAPDAPSGPSKLPKYLGAAVAVLGFAIYLTSFGPVFGTLTATPTAFLIITPVLAGLLAGVSLLPNQGDRSAIAAVLAVLGFLLLILVVLDEGSSIEWAFYPYIVFSVLQVIAAVGKLLLDAGLIHAPTPKPKPKQERQPYGQYGAPSSYYGQHSYGGSAPQQPSYPPQYGRGYQSGPNTGGFPAVGRPSSPQDELHSGPPTPPTGFPAFGQPQSPPEQSPQQAPQQSATPPS